MEISTEGVLVLASAKALSETYQQQEFNYDFPEGLSELLGKRAIIALQTSSGDELILDFDNSHESEGELEKEINQYITLAADDELLILSHAEFTQICSQNKGDYRQYRSEVEKAESMESGTYHVNVKVYSLDFDDYEAYFKLVISMAKVEVADSVNEVVEISD